MDLVGEFKKGARKPENRLFLASIGSLVIAISRLFKEGSEFANKIHYYSDMPDPIIAELI